MKTLGVIFLAFVLSIGFGFRIKAQIDTTAFSAIDSTLRITTDDGSVFIGILVKHDTNSITINSESLGIIKILESKIQKLELLHTDRFIEGEYWFENPNATRYLFGPTAIPLKKGEGYYQNTYIILQSINVGVSNNVSIGGGVDVILPFTGETPVIFVTPKVGFKVSEKWHFGGGILIGNLSDMGIAGIGYGVGTFGNTDHNLTGGVGWGYIDKKFENRPIITLSGMTRLARRVGLVSENWFVPMSFGYYPIISYGMRFMGEKITVDFAFLNNGDIIQVIIIGIPYLDFVVKF
jgi:hypothetical protein